MVFEGKSRLKKIQTWVCLLTTRPHPFTKNHSYFTLVAKTSTHKFNMPCSNIKMIRFCGNCPICKLEASTCNMCGKDEPVLFPAMCVALLQPKCKQQSAWAFSMLDHMYLFKSEMARQSTCIKTEKSFRAQISMYIMIGMITIVMRKGWDDKIVWLLVKIHLHHRMAVA